MVIAELLMNLKQPHRAGRYDTELLGDLYPSGAASGIK